MALSNTPPHTPPSAQNMSPIATPSTVRPVRLYINGCMPRSIFPYTIRITNAQFGAPLPHAINSPARAASYFKLFNPIAVGTRVQLPFNSKSIELGARIMWVSFDSEKDHDAFMAAMHLAPFNDGTQRIKLRSVWCRTRGESAVDRAERQMANGDWVRLERASVRAERDEELRQIRSGELDVGLVHFFCD